jgi:hypothetical protein
MGTAFGDLITNLKGGMRLCRFARMAADDFRISADQLVLLYLVSISVSIVAGYIENLPLPEFNIYAFTSEGFSAATLLLSAYLVARFVVRAPVTLALGILILSANLVFVVVWHTLQGSILDSIDDSTHYWWFYGGYMLWMLAVVLWIIRTLAGALSAKVFAAFGLMLLTWTTPVWYLAGGSSYWYAADADATEDSYRAYRELDSERMLFSQPEILARALDSLEPQREGVNDVYFVGVGAYATQDVFMKETLFARDMFVKRFDAEGHALTLLNHLSTRDDLPLATATNLEATLRHIGSTMDPEEDILVLYMTSHGSADHELSVDFWPLPLNDITPGMLSAYLDESGIKWRVVMISACYSGGFVEPLKNDYTAIATAAAQDRQSFGCSNENDFTYFGEALLKDQLQQEYSFPLAFAHAAEAIAAREAREHLQPSNPQYFVGEAIRPLLDSLSTRLQMPEATSTALN